MQKTKSILENKTHEILWSFEEYKQITQFRPECQTLC